MKISRFAWYWIYNLIVAIVGLIGFKLADDLGLISLAVLIIAGSVGGILIMTAIYWRNY